MSFIEEVKRVRNELGFGLIEARDAVTKYGTAEAAIQALDPNKADTNDPYARALKEKGRWSEKAREYKYGLMQIRNMANFDDLPDTVRAAVLEAINKGDSV